MSYFYKQLLFEEKRAPINCALTGNLCQLNKEIICVIFSKFVEKAPADLLKLRATCKYFFNLIQECGKDMFLRRLDTVCERPKPVFLTTSSALEIYCRFMIVIKGHQAVSLISNEISATFTFGQIIKMFDFFLTSYRNAESLRVQEVWISYILKNLSCVLKASESGHLISLESYAVHVLDCLKRKVSKNKDKAFEIESRLALFNIFRLPKFYYPIASKVFQFLLQLISSGVMNADCNKYICVYINCLCNSYQSLEYDSSRKSGKELQLENTQLVEIYKGLNESKSTMQIFSEVNQLLQFFSNLPLLRREIIFAMIKHYCNIQPKELNDLAIAQTILTTIVSNRILFVPYLEDGSLTLVFKHTIEILNQTLPFDKVVNTYYALGLEMNYKAILDKFMAFIVLITPHFIEEGLGALYNLYNVQREKLLFHSVIANIMLSLMTKISIKIQNGYLVKVIFDTLNNEIKQLPDYENKKDEWSASLNNLRDTYEYL